VRAATTRRDGLVTGKRERGFGKGPRHGGGGGGGGGGGRPPFHKGGDRGQGPRERDEGLSPQEMRDLAARKSINNPFATFFKKGEGEGQN
jgi:hypothetical protein